jgi:hypothetical protein
MQSNGTATPTPKVTLTGLCRLGPAASSDLDMIALASNVFPHLFPQRLRSDPAWDTAAVLLSSLAVFSPQRRATALELGAAFGNIARSPT